MFLFLALMIPANIFKVKFLVTVCSESVTTAKSRKKTVKTEKGLLKQRLPPSSPFV